MNRILFSIVLLLAGLGLSYGQVSLSNVAPTATIDFSNTMQAGVGTTPSTAYTGAGFSVNPSSGTLPGRLNSMAWETKGWTNGDLLFGAAMTNPAHARGSVNGAVITEGIYAFTDAPASVANPTLLLQGSDGDFAPGTIALRVKNTGTANMTQLEVSYNLFVRNDENTSSSFNFSHSPDNVVYVDEAGLDYVSPDVADAFQWTNIGVSPSRSIIITGINVAPNAFYYIRWSCADVSGVGGRDEFGLDDISLTATYGAPAPEINVLGGTYSILNNDMTPSITDGTQFSNTYTGGSQSIVNYVIQNVGGMPLNVTGVTITGLNAGDFTFFPAVTPTTLPGVSGSTISTMIVSVKFVPGLPGIRTANLNIASNDANENPYVFKMQGLGVVPQPDISVVGFTGTNLSPVFSTSMIPSVFNCTQYSTQVIGGPGQTNTFKIKSEGTAAQVILTGPSPYITIGGINPSDFTLVTWPATPTIFNGFFKTFSIKFSPTGSGVRTAVVTIANNDVINDVFGNPEGPYTFLISGVGVAPEMDITGNAQPVVSGSTTPAFANHTFFDYLDVASGSIDRTYTIQNSGNVALTLGGLTITGNPDFTLITPPPASIAIGGTSTFTIRYNPSSPGAGNATVSIVNDDYNENPYTFVIGGYGVNYTPCAYGAIETIGIQDFESAPATPVWTYSATAGASATNGTAFGMVGDGGTSNRFLGARSLQASNISSVVSMGVINTSLYSDVELNFRLSSLSTTIAEGTDATDKVVVSVSTNGTVWSNELEITGNTDAKWNFTSGSGIAAATYDGNNTSTVYAAGSGGFLTTNGYGTVLLSGLPRVATLYIRITVNTNSTTEVWALDNVSLFGRKDVTSTWNGSAWSNGTPTATVRAVIDGNFDTTTNGDLHACKCEIKPGRTVTIQPNDFIIIESDLDNKGVITVENNGSLVQQNDFATNAGIINVKRYTTGMTKFDYTYWSSPVQNQTLTNLTPLTPADKFYEFNPTINNWQNIPGSTQMLAGKGYIARAPQNFSTTVPASYVGGQFVGVTNNGFIQTPVGGVSGTWNLLGNPYPSAIDADLFLGFAANTGIMNGTIYFWTHNTPISNNVYTSNDYAVYNILGGVGTRAALNPGVNPSVPNGNIASGQGFFITGLGTGLATFNNSMRLAGANNSFFRLNSDTGALAFEKHRLWLNLTNDQGAFKQTLVGYATGATNELDRSFDGDLLVGANAISFYSIAAEKTLAIQGRALPFASDDIVMLGYSSSIEDVFTIGIENLDGIFETQDIYLKDKMLNIIHDLKDSPYAFSTMIGTFNDRFELRYTNASLGIGNYESVSNVIIAVKDQKISAFSSEENIRGIAVYDLLGRLLSEAKNINDTNFTISDISGGNQTLIVKVTLESGKIVNGKVIF